jgi:hypothetical protein
MVIIGAAFTFVGLVAYGLTLATHALTFRFGRPFFRSYRVRFWLCKLVTELFLETGFAWICAPIMLVFVSRLISGPAGTLISFGFPFILGQFVLIWVNLWAPLESSVIVKRMAALGLSPAQYPGGLPIGISDPAKGSMKKFFLIEEDLGLLWFTPTHLTYRGDSAAWDIYRDDLQEIERKVDPGAVSAYFGAIHVILHARQPDQSIRKIRLHPQSNWTLTRTTKALDSLARQIQSWKSNPPANGLLVENHP